MDLVMRNEGCAHSVDPRRQRPGRISAPQTEVRDRTELDKGRARPLLLVGANQRGAVGLHAEPEICQRPLCPFDQGGLGRRAVEAAVQLDPMQLFGVVGEHAGTGEVGRIEDPFPGRIAETRRAGKETAYDAATAERSRMTRSCNCPHAASASRPRVSRTVTVKPCASTKSLNLRTAARSGARYGVSSTGLNGIRLTCASLPRSSRPNSLASRSVSLTPANSTHS